MKDKDSGSCSVRSYCSTHCVEVVGLILLVVATFLTLVTLNGFGILGLFIVGLLLVTHKNWSCASCACPCHSNMECKPCAPEEKHPRVEKHTAGTAKAKTAHAKK